MNELLRALRVAQTSTGRFKTLRATIRDWSDPVAIFRAQEEEWRGEPDEEWDNTRTLWLVLDKLPKEPLWWDEEPVPYRARAESEWWVVGCDGSSWWGLDKETKEVAAADAARLFLHLIDAERGVLLRAESRYQGQTIAIEEMLEVAFDEELRDELFEAPA